MTRFLSAPVTSTVVRFLLDRLDEDYDEIDHLGRAARADASVKQNGSHQHHPDGLRSVERMRSEIIAKRHAIGDLQQLLILRDQPFEEPVRALASSALCALAVPYVDHPRFDTQWLRT